MTCKCKCCGAESEGGPPFCECVLRHGNPYTFAYCETCNQCVFHHMDTCPDMPIGLQQKRALATLGSVTTSPTSDK